MGDIFPICAGKKNNCGRLIFGLLLAHCAEKCLRGGTAATAAADMHCPRPAEAEPACLCGSAGCCLQSATVRHGAHTEPLSHTEWHKLSAIIMMVGLGRQSSSARNCYQLTAQAKIIGLPPRHYLKCLHVCERASQSVSRQRVRSALCTVCYSLAAAHVVVSLWLFSWARCEPQPAQVWWWCPPWKSLSCCALGVDPKLKPAPECKIVAWERGVTPLAPSCCVGATYYTDMRPVGALLRKTR
ncbi:hypothetical protein NDU88_007150 [Pleurodeles waltl]|uniref:Uncharacterized protein n=1 Tax=Pleurodeles waltl TaxID=8319 RepID=A0AAV7SRK1_PLEWA|nr:hypothetical protein NDU88_007150 [Pleurodeles waltl]